MKITKIVFSPTGGTMRIVESLFDGQLYEDREINLITKDIDFSSVKIEHDELVVIAMPSYSGRAPEMALKRLNMIDGNGAPCVLVVSYGNRDYEDTLLEMSDAAKTCGFIPFAAVSGIAEHSIDRETAAGRPDSDDKQKLRKIGKKILGEFKNCKALCYVPGHMPYKELQGGSNCPEPGEGCTKCDICRQECPADAIDIQMIGNPQKCISCMRCIKVCPEGARALDDITSKRIHSYLKLNCRVRKEPELFIE